MSAARSRRANDKHNHLQRTPILVMGCSLLIACCIAFGGTNWTASAQPSEDQLPEQNAIVEPGYYQETIGSYEAISQSDDDERAENLRLAAEAINGYVIEPGATFSFNEVVGDTTAERGYKEAPGSLQQWLRFKRWRRHLPGLNCTLYRSGKGRPRNR